MQLSISNKMSLLNKHIILTGANGLLGKNFANAILTKGAKILAVDINFVGFQEQIDPRYQNNVRYFEIDITNEIQILEFFATLESEKISIDGLVNNAALNPKVEDGGHGLVGLENLNYVQWKKEIDLGLWAAVNISRHVAQNMVQNNVRGSIVNIGSDYGHLAPKQSLYEKDSRKPITYSVVKYGIVGLTKYFATYYAEKGIRVNCLSPGGIFNNQDANFLNKISKEIPLGRMADKSELNGALIFLLSEENSYVTGVDLIVDGGRSIW